MIDLTTVKKVYIIPGATDLRNGIDGYAIIVQEHFHLNPFNNSLYLFCNKYHNKIKILHYEDNGFWLYYKRIDTGTLKWPKDSSEIKEINFKQFRWLLDGLKVDQKGLKTANPEKII